MQEINFIKTTIENYNKEPTHSPNNIYFITDQKDLYLGDIKIGSAFVVVDDHNPIPNKGIERTFYIDKRNGSFSIKVWDSLNNQYVALPLADTSYIKTISRRNDEIVGTSGDNTESVVSLDTTITNSEIDYLFKG